YSVARRVAAELPRHSLLPEGWVRHLRHSSLPAREPVAGRSPDDADPRAGSITRAGAPRVTRPIATPLVAAVDRREGLTLTDAERRRYRRVEWLADLLDNAIRIPGTPWRFGLDPILGLIPGLGDALGAFASAWILIEAARFGVSGPVLLRML